jgi:HEAT repeat protein
MRIGMLSVFIFFLMAVLTPVRSQQTDQSHDLALIHQFHDANWKTRSEAFFALFHGESSLASLSATAPQQADDIKVGLIDLLETENAVVESGVSLTEEYTEYYASLIAAVASLKDTRALYGLLGAIRTGGMATRALAEFGTIAIDPIIEKLNSGDRVTRAFAADVLGQMLEPKNYPKVSALSQDKKSNWPLSEQQKTPTIS